MRKSIGVIQWARAHASLHFHFCLFVLSAGSNAPAYTEYDTRIITKQTNAKIQNRCSTNRRFSFWFNALKKSVTKCLISLIKFTITLFKRRQSNMNRFSGTKSAKKKLSSTTFCNFSISKMNVCCGRKIIYRNERKTLMHGWMNRSRSATISLFTFHNEHIAKKIERPLNSERGWDRGGEREYNIHR